MKERALWVLTCAALGLAAYSLVRPNPAISADAETTTTINSAEPFVPAISIPQKVQVAPPRGPHPERHAQIETRGIREAGNTGIPFSALSKEEQFTIAEAELDAKRERFDAYVEPDLATPDSTWATTQTSNFADFVEHSGLAELDAIECGKTTCRAELSFRSDADVELFFSHRQRAVNPWARGSLQVVHRQPNTARKLTLYALPDSSRRVSWEERSAKED